MAGEDEGVGGFYERGVVAVRDAGGGGVWAAEEGDGVADIVDVGWPLGVSSCVGGVRGVGGVGEIGGEAVI